MVYSDKLWLVGCGYSDLVVGNTWWRTTHESSVGDIPVCGISNIIINPFISRVITYLRSGMSHQFIVVNSD
jgi:hypothetical protein